MHKRHFGFTLLEIITTIAITSIFLLFATPSWQTWRQQQTIKMLTQQLIQTITFARQQALITHQTIIVCPQSATQNCGNDWQNGWIITTFDKQHTFYHFTPTSKQLHLRWQDLRSTNQLTFQPNGTTEGSNGSFYYADCQLIINRSGRVRLAKC